jgi:hypothetical protein
MSYKKTNKLSQLCISLILVVFSLSISANDNPQQIVSVQGSPVGIVGHSVQIDIGYNTSNSDNTTTGLGFRIHYNSDLIDISNIIYVLDKDLVVDITGPLEDTDNHDNDSDTDQYYSVGWASLFGDWPNDELPAKLLSLQVDVNQAVDIQQTNSTPINFSSTALAAGYEFLAENYDLELIASTWDFDGSCHADALTDGLILLRYGFDLHGENLISGVMHPDSTMTAAEVEAKIENATSIIDIDMDGEFGALTDGLLVLRYLFDLSGQNLIDGVISTTATRTSIEEITQHLERHMPNCLDTIGSRPPIITSGATAVAINENSGAGQVVYTATADNSADLADTPFVYSLAEGSDAALSIDAETGAVTLATDPDHETQSQYSFAVIATDAAGNASEAQSVTLDINDLDDAAPTVTSGATAVAIDENSGAGQVIYTATSDDSGDDVVEAPITYSLAEGSDAALSIDASTGAVTLTTDPDHETQAQHSFAVIATDAAGNVSDAQSVTLDINDLDEVAPTVTSGATAVAIVENSGADQVIYTATADDSADISNGFTFSLTEGSDAALSIDSVTGEVSLATDPDHETQSQYSFAVIATDAAGNASTEQAVTLDINDLDEVAPTVTSGDTAVAIDENSGAGQVIYTAAADDTADISDGFTFSLAEGSDAALSIDSVTGAVTLATDPDHEAQSQYSFAVIATDAVGNSAQQLVTVAINQVVVVNENTHGPLDMTNAYGNGSVSGVNGEFFKNDTSIGAEFAGFANATIDVYPFEFGTGGTLEFTASVPTGESVDVSFQLHKQGSDSGLLCDIGPVWNSDATTVSSANAQTFTIDIPAQGGDTFSNMIMELSEDDIDVKITDVYVTTSEKTDAEQTVPAQCDGSLDMTGAYGNGAVSGEGEEAGTLFMNDTSLGMAFSGFANTTTDVYPYEFGTGGTLEFTASVPEGQSTTAVDVNFQFKKQGSDTGKFCDIAPIWESSNTVSGPVDETFTIAIPSQGGNTFRNLIMELSVDDVNVKITGVKVTPSTKTADAPTVPEICVASPFPSVYPVDGLNSAAMFNGTFGDEEGGLATIQYDDTYEFPTNSASYGGWSNSNPTLYPIEFTGGGFFARRIIYFCASTTEAATVYFRFENEVYPANSTIYNTANVSLTADGVMRAYSSNVNITYAVNSLLFLMLERDTAITVGKVMGNWNGLPTQNITTDTDGDGVVDYCEDFPNDTPDWVDTDNDGANDDADAFPEDATQW